MPPVLHDSPRPCTGGRRAARAGALVLGLAILAAGCGATVRPRTAARTSTTLADPSVPAAVTVPASVCALVAPAEVQQVVGVSVGQGTESDQTGGGHQCTYPVRGGTSVILYVFVLAACANGAPPTAACESAISNLYSATIQSLASDGDTITQVTGLGKTAVCDVTSGSASAKLSTVWVLESWFEASATADSCGHARQLVTTLLERI